MKQFIQKLLSAESSESSKRFNATLCIISMILLVMIVVLFEIDIKSAHESLIKTIFSGGLILLGVTAIEKIMKK